MIKTLRKKYHSFKYRNLLNGFLSVVFAIPFLMKGLNIIIWQGTKSNQLWIPFLGISICIFTGIFSMYGFHSHKHSSLKDK